MLKLNYRTFDDKIVFKSFAIVILKVQVVEQSIQT